MVRCTHGRNLGLPQPTCEIMCILSLNWPTQMKTGKSNWKPIYSGGMYVQIQSMFSVFILLHFLSMANEPPAKWKPSADVTEPHLTKCGEPSFDDGNIIIAVEQTHFCVYGGVLNLSLRFLPTCSRILSPPKPTCEIMGVLSLNWPTQLKTGKWYWMEMSCKIFEYIQNVNVKRSGPTIVGWDAFTNKFLILVYI